MSPFLNRSKRAGPLLEWKVRAFTVGAALALIGMYLERRWVTGLAIVVLASGMALSLWAGHAAPDVEPDAAFEPASEEGSADSEVEVRGDEARPPAG